MALSLESQRAHLVLAAGILQDQIPFGLDSTDPLISAIPNLHRFIAYRIPIETPSEIYDQVTAISGISGVFAAIYTLDKNFPRDVVSSDGKTQWLCAFMRALSQLLVEFKQPASYPNTDVFDTLREVVTKQMPAEELVGFFGAGKYIVDAVAREQNPVEICNLLLAQYKVILSQLDQMPEAERLSFLPFAAAVNSYAQLIQLYIEQHTTVQGIV